jgi:mannosyl-oligosaccharide alpha-1,2-mannosidase
MEHLRSLHPMDGLYPLTYFKSDGSPADRMLPPTVSCLCITNCNAEKASVGAFADSSYEYFLKQWLLSNRTEPSLRDMCPSCSLTVHDLLLILLYSDVQSATGIINHLLYLSPERGLLYVTDTDYGVPSGVFEHLSCFLAGTLALGAYTIPGLPRTHMYAAEGLAHTCWITYADQASGLGRTWTFRSTTIHAIALTSPTHLLSQSADVMHFPSPSNMTGRWITAYERWEHGGSMGDPPGVGQTTPVRAGEKTEYNVRSAKYLLRPETVESFFMLWKITGDVRWRERGWAVFEAIERAAKVAGGYASLSDVRKENPVPMNEMPRYYPL